jgi:hypothetical protein
MAEKLGTLLQLYYRPSRALSTILDSGSLALAVIGAAVLGLALGEITRVVLIAVLFVPASIAIISLWDHLGSVSVVLRRDYSPLLVCALMCWIAAGIPGALAGFIAPALTFWIHAAVDLYFLALAAIAVRTVFGTSIGKAVGTVLGATACSPISLPHSSSSGSTSCSAPISTCSLVLAAVCARAKTSAGTWTL